jgi:hypothetical protein
MLGSKQYCAGATLCSYYLCGIQMNANELAEIIEHLENARYIGASKAAEMLRQQQAEIEALKRHRDRLETLAEKMLQGSGEEDEQ